MVKRIDAYRLLEIIGEGRYGKVYLGENEQTKEKVAIKAIKVQIIKSLPKLEQLMLNEYQALFALQKSSHIVRFIKLVTTKNNYYFVYEYCNGGTLKDFIQIKGKMDEEKALEYFKQLVQVFRLLNQNRFMHRNLNSSSILIHNGILKLTNFQFCHNPNSQNVFNEKDLEFPLFIPPQLPKGQNYDQKSQIWFLGVLLYEMLFGEYVYQEQVIQKLMKVSSQNDINWPLDVQVSPETKKLVTSMLAQDTFQRMYWQELFEYFNKEQKKVKNLDNQEEMNIKFMRFGIE